jgi:hypothetical protein
MPPVFNIHHKPVPSQPIFNVRFDTDIDAPPPEDPMDRFLLPFKLQIKGLQEENALLRDQIRSMAFDNSLLDELKKEVINTVLFFNSCSTLIITIE